MSDIKSDNVLSVLEILAGLASNGLIERISVECVSTDGSILKIQEPSLVVENCEEVST